jgi:polysaccharide export outer membrane protein
MNRVQICMGEGGLTAGFTARNSGLLGWMLCAMLALAGGLGPAAASGAEAASAVPATEAQQYVIGHGDILKIFVLQNQELSVEVPVRPDGKISTPLVSDMVAVGKTSTQLARDIEEVLKQYVRTPNVSIIVTHSNGVFSQVKVVGQAVSPRAVPYRSGMTVLDLVIQVGGLSQFAAGNRAKIVRTDGKSSQEIKVRLDDLLNKGKVSANIALQPGDILVIPESRF